MSKSSMIKPMFITPLFYHWNFEVIQTAMSIKSLPNTDGKHLSKSAASNRQHLNPLKNCFSIKNGAWFVTNADDEQAGPFSNKSDAQMALVFYVARTCWPNAKQLREISRSGR